MRLVGCLAVPVAVLTWSFAAHCSAEEAKPLAEFAGTGAHVKWLALSADGSRLAAAAADWKIEKNKIVKVPGIAAVWDVDGQRKVCTLQSPKAEFTHLWLSADGKTLVTVDHGIPNINCVEEFAVISNAYQAWDVTTGKAIGSGIKAKQGGSFTAAALSPDGRYVATVGMDVMPGPVPVSPSKPYTAGEIRVWDVREQKAKWTLPGTPHTGKFLWVDSLAFSPDGTRVAAYRSLGAPSPEAAVVNPDRRDAAFKPLKVLALEPGKEAPAVTVMDRPGVPLPVMVAWPGDGRTLVLRDGLSFEVVDVAAGRTKDSFKLSMSQLQGAPAPGPNGAEAGGNGVPQARGPMQRPKKGSGMLPLPPRPAQGRLPLPDTTAEDVPQNFHGSRTALSADGTRFALYLQVARDAKHLVENRVVLWDVGTRKLLGAVRLPDESYSLYKGHAPWGWKKDANEPSCEVALSGDGKRVAASDAVGMVRVYDATRFR